MGGTIVPNVWQHVAGVYDGQSLRIFINGQQVETTAETSGNIIKNIVPAAIGSDNVSTSALNFAGLLDDFRIHLTALSYDELAGGAFVRVQISSPVDGASVISWRANFVNYRLQSSNPFDGLWSEVLDKPTLVGGNLVVTNRLAVPRSVFRLIYP